MEVVILIFQKLITLNFLWEALALFRIFSQSLEKYSSRTRNEEKYSTAIRSDVHSLRNLHCALENSRLVSIRALSIGIDRSRGEVKRARDTFASPRHFVVFPGLRVRLSCHFVTFSHIFSLEMIACPGHYFLLQSPLAQILRH